MDTEQRRRGVDVSHDQGDCVLFASQLGSAEFAAKAVDAELAPASGEISGRDLSDLFGGHINIIAGCADGLAFCSCRTSGALAPTLAFA